MDYAKSLVQGEGWAWGGQSDPVEGFTTPLWTAMMALIHLLPLPVARMALGVQALALLVLLVHLVALSSLVRRHFTPGDSAVPALFAVAATALYYPLSYWSLMGMETGLQALLLTLLVRYTLDVHSGENRYLSLFAVCSLAYLTRMDMAIAILLAILFLAWEGRLRSRERRSWAPGVLLLVSTVLGYQLFRQLYFGDPLPNTYYLKLTGVPLALRLERGWRMLELFGYRHLVALSLAALVVLPWLRRHWKPRLPLLVWIGYLGYSVWVGGDAWDEGVRAGRFVAFAMPQLFVAVAAGLGLWEKRLGSVGSRRIRPQPAAAVSAGLLVLLFAGVLLAPDSEANRDRLRLEEPPYLATSHMLVTQNLLELRPLLRPGAVVVTFWAGIPAYFGDFRWVDGFGYNDRHTARLPADEDLIAANGYVPGHAKVDLPYLLDEVRPDAFFQAWGIGEEDLRRRGYRRLGEFWLRRGSEQVRWHRVQQARRAARAGDSE